MLNNIPIYSMDLLLPTGNQKVLEEIQELNGYNNKKIETNHFTY